MKLPRRNFLHLAAGATALPAVSRIAAAQTYPSRPVRIIVGYPPGGATDAMGRLIAQQLSERLGQQFIVENRPGPGGNIGTEAVLRSEPDCYTLLLIFSANAINATFYNKLSFNFMREIAPIASIARSPFASFAFFAAASSFVTSCLAASASERIGVRGCLPVLVGQIDPVRY
jgi:tripartite-type tricarboxylate transporter receptor subunit TctC